MKPTSNEKKKCWDISLYCLNFKVLPNGLKVPQIDTVCQIPEIENRENKTASFFLFNQMYTSRNREKKNPIFGQDQY